MLITVQTYFAAINLLKINLFWYFLWKCAFGKTIFILPSLNAFCTDQFWTKQIHFHLFLLFDNYILKDKLCRKEKKTAKLFIGQQIKISYS